MVKKSRNVLVLITLLLLGYGLFTSNFHIIYSSALTLLTLIAVEVFFRFCRVKVPPILPIWDYIFVFLSMTLGKTLNFYGIPYWDKFLHITSGVILAFVGLLFLWSINAKGKELHPKVVIWFVIIFSIACAGVWEMYEFTTDALFGLTAQNGSLNDTMWDIICGTIGGSIVAFFLYLYYYKDKKFKVFKDTFTYMSK